MPLKKSAFFTIHAENEQDNRGAWDGKCSDPPFVGGN